GSSSPRSGPRSSLARSTSSGPTSANGEKGGFMASTVASPTRKKAAMASATSVSPRRIAPAVRIRRRVMPLHSVRMSPRHLRMRAGPRDARSDARTVDASVAGLGLRGADGGTAANRAHGARTSTGGGGVARRRVERRRRAGTWIGGLRAGDTGDQDAEERAFAEPAGGRHGAAERLGELPYDTQPEADAAGTACATRSELVEGIEHDFDVLGRNAWPRIRHVDRHPPGLGEVCAHGDPARLGELDGIVHQVAHDLLDLHAVRLDFGDLRLHRHGQRDVRAAQASALQRLDLGEERREREALEVERHLARAQAGEVEDARDELELVPRVAVDG